MKRTNWLLWIGLLLNTIGSLTLAITAGALGASEGVTVAVILAVAVKLGVTVADSLLIVAIASVVAAWLGWKLHLACD